MALSALLWIPLWIIIFVVFIIILLLLFWLWALIDCLISKLTPLQKLLWVVVILVFNIFGAILYLIFSKAGGEKIVAKDIKGKRLLRSRKNRVIAGVCGGLGDYFNVDPTLIRLVWVLFIFISFGAAILAYIIAWIIVPEK